MIVYTGSGERIDTRLSKEFSYSRSFFHHIIERGGVQVNGKIIKKSYHLKNNDKITIDNLKRYLSPTLLDEAPKIDIPILIEKEDYLVINKPKGVLTHPKTIREIHEPSVAGFLYHKFKKLPSIGNFIRAGILHRLDKNTDGLMIIAKTEKGLEHFKKLFEKKSEINIKNIEKTSIKKNTTLSGSSPNFSDFSIPLRKFYRATCEITPEGKKFIEGIKTFPYFIEEIVKAKLPHTIPKVGITKILSIQIQAGNSEQEAKIGNLGLGTCNLELEILTGRTHQIRYHLSHHGLPIVGDYLYGNPKTQELMQLTAYKLIFRNPDNELITVKI